MDNLVNCLLSYDDIELICTCIQFTKSWAKCFDDDEHRDICNDLIKRLRYYRYPNEFPIEVHNEKG